MGSLILELNQLTGLVGGWSNFYGIVTLLVCLLAWAGGDHVHQKLSMLLLAAWSAGNIAVQWQGFERAPLLIPSLDAAVAIMVAVVGQRNRSEVGLAVFVLFLLTGLAWVVFFSNHTQSTYTCFATMNLLHLTRAAVIGGAGVARVALRYRLHGGWARLWHHGPSGPGMAQDGP